MHSNHYVAVATAMLLATASLAYAQDEPTDSVLAVSSGGASLFRVNVNGAAVLFGEYDAGSSSGGIPVEGPGTRLMWYPTKAAFRAGHVDGTQWDDANVGHFSVAMGENVTASGAHSIAIGVRTAATRVGAFAAGTENSATGDYSVALGYHAHTNARPGTFVFADASTNDTLRASVNNSARWRTAGGFHIYTSANLSTGISFQSGTNVSPWGQSSAVISTSTGALLTTGGVWQNASDANLKYAFEEVDGEEVLEKLRTLPVESWSYKVEGEGIRHIGPTAQDFYAAFGLGTSETSIGTVDADGVALVAAKALERRTTELVGQVEEDRAELEALRNEVTRLREEVAVLRARLEALEAIEARLVRLEAGG